MPPKRKAKAKKPKEPLSDVDSDFDFIDGPAKKRAAATAAAKKKGDKKAKATDSAADAPDKTATQEPGTTEQKDEKPAKKKAKVSRKVADIKKKQLGAWMDIPEWTNNISPLVDNCPIEVIDWILGDEGLNIRDHVALAATCKTFRVAYSTEEVWKALLAVRQLESVADDLYNDFRDEAGDLGKSATTSEEQKHLRTVIHIFSNAPNIRASDFQLVTIAGGKPVVAISPSHSTAVFKINEQRINQTNAKAHYKVSPAELKNLTSKDEYNRHNPQAPKKMYREYSVQALAYHAHGGPLGHAQHMNKVKTTAAKARATKEANGAPPPKAPRVGKDMDRHLPREAYDKTYGGYVGYHAYFNGEGEEYYRSD